MTELPCSGFSSENTGTATLRDVGRRLKRSTRSRLWPAWHILMMLGSIS
jgi:hypothetical protein